MIASYLQLLQRRYQGKLDADADEFILYAVEGASRLKSLLHDLLMLQQIGKAGRDRTVVPLAELVDRAVASLGPAAQGVEIDCGPLPSSCVDAREFVQLFEHLIGNAIKYVRPGVTPKISITADDSVEGKIVTVRDNGIGIEKDCVRKIFDVFQRLHSRSEYPGTGIGLSICRKVVEVHGGRIWVESEPGAGSSFRFTVPGAA
jgi:light-regulated signal transduction histidine kinase (bacteriophytochrome)